MKHEQGFTLVELLIVMAIIGVLAAMMFPALGAVRKRAYATQSHELVGQLQNAWKIHFNDFRSFPSAKLFDGAKEDSEGDITFVMSPKNLCLLNWRCDKPTDYTGTRKEWMEDLHDEIKKNVDAKTDNKPHSMKVADFSVSTRDAYFEINQVQWICGVLNVWGERKAMALYKKEGRTGAERVVQEMTGDSLADPRVSVKLDVGYDDKVLSPAEADPSATASTINRIAIAWVKGQSDKDEVIVSW